ncbi:MAG: type I-E CRISPR-associated protein Cse1/CasA, partial [Chthonomonadaceae bacterium]|nr:type I-E CRISPR-associated protein Cse1/CasA [Chthonomonadaceae bacterium]
MNRPTFNVLTEPWIPVIRLDGTRDELGILPCLEQAHELREIRDPSPIIEFGLYRLLVAFVLDALVMADKRPEDP